MKVLCIGYGSIGKRHCANLKALGHHVIAADPYSQAPKPDGTVTLFYREWSKMLKDHRDAAGVVIASPTAEHQAQIVTTAWAGLPAYIEKPVMTVEQYLKWVGQPDAMSLPSLQDKCAVGFQYRFSNGIAAAREHMRTSVSRLAPLTLFVAQDDLLARYGADVDSVIACHAIANALYLLGPTGVVDIISDGRSLVGTIEHVKGRQSVYRCYIDRGPRISYIALDGWPVDLDASPEPYKLSIAAWLAWVVGGERDPRTATLADGLAVSEVLAQVKHTEAVT